MKIFCIKQYDYLGRRSTKEFWKRNKIFQINDFQTHARHNQNLFTYKNNIKISVL